MGCGDSVIARPSVILLLCQTVHYVEYIHMARQTNHLDDQETMYLHV